MADHAAAPFALDTSGSVALMGYKGAIAVEEFRWEDLTPFAQSYIQEMFEELSGVKTPWGAGYDVVRRLAFRDLGQITLEQIMKDCSLFQAGISPTSSMPGSEFWANRQIGAYDGALFNFPPLTLHVGETGHVYFQPTP